MLALRGMQSTLSLLLFLSLPWPRVVAPESPIYGSNRTKLHTLAQLNCLKENCSCIKMDLAWIDKPWRTPRVLNKLQRNIFVLHCLPIILKIKFICYYVANTSPWYERITFKAITRFHYDKWNWLVYTADSWIMSTEIRQDQFQI